MKSRPSELEKLLSTDPGQNKILQALDVRDYGRLTLTDKSMSQFFKKRHSSFWLTKLACCLAQEPHDDKVRFILKSNLGLLDIVFPKVELQSLTVFNVTPLQLVYGAKDHEMCQTLAPFFEEKYGSVDAGENEMQRQISELKNYHKSFDFTPIIQAISNEPFNTIDPVTNKLKLLSPATLAAIDKFRKDFAESQPESIDKGMQFRWETLQELDAAYGQAAAQWNHNCYYKCALVEDVVYACVLGYIPENGAQHCNQGLSYLYKDNNPEPLRRMQKTRVGSLNFYEALKQPCVDFVLDSSCVDIIYGRGRGAVSGPWGGVGACWGAHVYLQNFCQTKTSTWRTYAATEPKFETSRLYNSLT